MDHVAWAIARKYEVADLRAYECIADKIVVEQDAESVILIEAEFDCVAIVIRSGVYPP